MKIFQIQFCAIDNSLNFNSFSSIFYYFPAAGLDSSIIHCILFDYILFNLVHANKKKLVHKWQDIISSAFKKGHWLR